MGVVGGPHLQMRCAPQRVLVGIYRPGCVTDTLHRPKPIGESSGPQH